MRLLAIVLTSSDEFLALQAVRSIQDQAERIFTVTPKVIVNTLDKFYFQRVRDIIPDTIEVVQTESNGRPGKGHNSCIRYFESQQEYDYLLLMDGDDCLYPYALNTLGRVLEQLPDTDLIQLIYNDNLWSNGQGRLKLSGDVYADLIESSDMETWPVEKVADPFKHGLLVSKTPTRPLLFSRRATRLCYSENMAVYDDMIMFLNIAESELSGELNTVTIPNPNIYLYSRLGGGNVSLKNFDEELEQKVFKQESASFLKKYTWDDLKRLPFLNIQDMYPLADKVEFILQYVNQYVNHWTSYMPKTRQERRLLIQKLLGVRKMLHFYNHPGLCNLIAKHMYANGDMEGAHSLALCSSEPDQTFLQLTSYKPPKNQVFKPTEYPKAAGSKKVIAFYTGISGPYNGRDYAESEVYGSEIAVINMAEQLTKSGYSVHVFGNCPKESMHRGVEYHTFSSYRNFSVENRIHILIVSRFMHFFRHFKAEADKVFLWVHDALVHYTNLDGSLIPGFGKNLFKNLLPSLDRVICVSNWQRNLIVDFYEIPTSLEHKFAVIPNATRSEYFPEGAPFPKKIPDSFIYASDPARGLPMILDQWENIKRVMPDSTLDIYFGSLPEALKERVEQLDGVTFHGKISDSDLCGEFKRHDYFLYPFDSHETFCINALQACLAGCYPIVTDYSHVARMVKDNHGFVLPREKTERASKIVDTLLTVRKDKLVHQKRVYDSIRKTNDWQWESCAEKIKILFQ